MHRSWIKPLARAGYASRGLIYSIVSLFAFLAAIGQSGTENTKGALERILQQPFGNIMVFLLVVGLIGYVLWRLVQSLFDTDGHGFSPKGLAVRAGLLASAFTYGTLALFAVSRLGAGLGTDEHGGIGRYADAISAIVGANYVALGFCLVLFGVACAHFWKAWTGKYQDHFKADEAAMKVIHPISKIGLSARGVVFLILSLLSFYRFLSFEDGPEKPGLKDALAFVQGLPFGSWLLTAIGIGLMAFAAYSVIEAIWRRINVEDA